MNKTIIIGLDGADFRYIDPMLKRGELPNIREIINKGFSAEFNSSEVPYTAQAWSTILTGRDAGEHGVYDTMVLDEKYNKLIAHSGGLQVKYFWHYLSERNIKSLIINVPMVYPARECEKAKIISGFEAPIDGKSFCFPWDYLAQLKAKGITYDWHKTQSRLCKLHNVKKYFDEFKSGILQQYKAVSVIAKAEDWDCLLTVFQFTDWINHRTKQIDLIEDIYSELDKVIGRFLNNFPDANIFILSDHGGSPADYRISISKLLSDLGLLKFKLQPASHNIIQSGAKRKCRSKLLSSLLAKCYRLFTENIKLLITKILIKRYPHLILKCGVIDYQKSKVFYKGLGSIYINTKSKFSHGMVKDDECIEIKAAIKNALDNIRDSRSRQIIESFDPAIVWHLNKTAAKYVVPDLVIRPGLRGYYITDIGFSGELIEQIDKDIGVHFKTGILFGAGPCIPKLSEQIKADLVDFAPTLFGSLGLPIPSSFTGYSLINNDAEREDYKSAAFVRKQGDELAKDETEEIKETLRTLGYL